MFRIVMMELGIELILLWSSPGIWNLLFHLLTSINPNFDWMPIVRSALPNHSDSSNMDANYILYLPSSGLTLETLGRSSSQSDHRESDELNSETTEGNDMPRGRASAKARNSIPYEDSDTSSHKRKTHFEQQSTVIQNGSPKRQAVNRASKYSSCLMSITLIYTLSSSCRKDDDVMDSTHMGAQPSVELISTQPSSSFSSIENTKKFFDKLITLPLEVLSDPEKESSMKKVLSILADNLSLFPEKQGDQILELLLEFPVLVHNWRECYSQFQMYRQQSSTETEKIRNLVENSGKDEESLKFRYKKLGNNEKEMMKELEAEQKEKAEIAEQKIGKSKQTKDYQKKEERLMRIAATKLNNLSDQWAKLKSVFI